jgi:hypothetical protein
MWSPHCIFIVVLTAKCHQYSKGFVVSSSMTLFLMQNLSEIENQNGNSDFVMKPRSAYSVASLTIVLRLATGRVGII